MKIDTLIYDCETKKYGSFKDPQKNMGFLCGVVYSYNQDRYFIFDNPSELIRALNGNICVSFNGLNFDTRLLLGNKRQYSPQVPLFNVRGTDKGKLFSWQEYDLFLVILSSFFKKKLIDVIKRMSPGGLSLDALCQTTLTRSKIKTTKQSTFLEIVEYCLNDVRITRQLFDFAMKNNFVRSPKQGRINIPQKYLNI